MKQIDQFTSLRCGTDEAVMTKRKKRRAVRNTPSEQHYNLSDQVAEKADLEYHELKEQQA